MSFKGDVHDFSADYNAIDKSDTLDIHKHLMVKGATKLHSFVIITFFNTSLSEFEFSTYYFGKLVFPLFVFDIFYFCSKF